VRQQSQKEATPSDGEEKPDEQDKVTPDSGNQDSPDKELTDKEDIPVSSSKKNVVKVSMATAYNLINPETYQIKLQGEGVEETKELRLELNKEESESGNTYVAFEVEPGDYVLEVSNPRYLTYKQEFSVEADYNYSVALSNGWLAGYEYQSAAVHPGVIKRGDVNHDGSLDDKDVDLIIKAIEENAESSSDCNLNNDDKVSLADLQCLAESLYREGDNISSVERSISERVLSVELDPADRDKIEIVDGELGNILRASADGIKLKWKEGTPISEENPIKVAFPVAEDKSKEMGGLTLRGNKDNSITEGIIEVEVETEDGGTEIIPIEIPNPQMAMFAMLRSGGPSAKWENGILVVDFAGQVAVKKVTIVITGTQSNNLAEISTVEFLNNMEERIPAPQMDIPQNLSVVEADKMFTVSWDPCVNITGYEVEISAETKDGTIVTETKRTAQTSLTVSSFNGDELVNKTVYTVRVQSLNGEWKSGYGEEIQAIPFTTKKPPAPDNLTLKAGYRTITAGWKKMEDTDTYNLFYKKETDTEFTKVSGIEENSYQITGLEDLVSYEVYVTGVNDNGEGPASLHSKIATIAIEPAKLPEYRLINTSSGEGILSSHIVSAVIQGSSVRSMVDSPLDSEDAKSALGVFDNLYTSYYNIADWDDGCSYYAGNKGLTVTFDESCHIGYISFAQAIEINSISGVRVYADGTEVKGISLVKRLDENNRAWYLIKFPEGVQATKLQICINSYGRGLSIAEMRFHGYDSLENDIYNLFSDDLYTTLREDVTQADLDALQTRLDTQVNNEYHIDREMIQKELDNAKSIFAQQGLGNIVNIHTSLTSKQDGGKGFGGLNSWQPIGVSAYADENVVIYVGSNKGKTGDATDLYLYATQYHSESGGFVSQVARLKVGRNEVSIPKITDRDFEKGGSLYVAYNGNNQNDRYAVRVSGGTDIPVLDLYQIEEDSEEWNTRITAYVEALEKKVPELENIHNTKHKGNVAVDYDYDKTNCIAGATEIMLDLMMYSVSSEQILAGLGTGTVQEKAEKLSSSLTAMNQMMYLYYQHKGLNDNADAQVDKLPSQHLNIRYHRMFAGAFMYAGGNHIGIEWGSVSGLSSGKKLVEENGKYVSGQMFGWGIGHEIGHDINQGTYAIAEITNNYFAQLSTRGAEVNSTARFRYQSVYDYVTSGSVGRPSNGTVALAMYWQLHLAYDRGYNYKTYENYEEQLANLFYARVDTYSRTPSKAPTGNGEIALALNGGIEQNFIRLASAAAERDLTDFFVHWGYIPDEETTAYISQFEPETRAIYYVNDESRVYEIENGTAATIKGQDILNDMQAVVDTNIRNDVKIELGHNANPEIVLGYEIIRCTISDGKVQEQVVGFTTESEFTDHVTAINNRVLTYKVAAVDHFMNRSAVKTLAPVKIEHDGDHGKALWEVELNNITPVEENKTENTEDYPDEEIVEDGRNNIIDNDAATVFKGTASVGKEVSVVLDFHQSLTVTGVRYRAGGESSVGSYKVYISEDKTNWKQVSEGELNALEKDQKIYFQEGEDPWICTYKAAYLKFVIEGRDGKEITIPEIDVLGPSGDNVDFRAADDGQPIIGILKNDYVVDSAKDEKIPAGSLVFIGKYKGNPAYNVGILYDENGTIVGGIDENGALKAEQVILADVPDKGELGETSDGTWVYWIAHENLDTNNLPKKVRAELYRVNNALTNEGQRLVSDSMFYDVPAVLPEIELTNQ
ncbi:MAG: fibronectin type III domain-containing protein, partial [Lachnospiraceae bacterium]|nr:fibronectin type III domain-containing protein [Lachnospiraceae bacterium]